MSIILRVLLCLTAAHFLSGQAAADKRFQKATAEVGISERLDSQIPLDTFFRDSDGQPVQLKDYFQADRPVVLSLYYSDCPMLCDLHLNELIESMKELDLTVGTDFDILCVSINPTESADQAQHSKQLLLYRYERANSAAGFHFLTGRKNAIDQLAESVGFRYKYIESAGHYAHASAAIFLTPQGKVSRYLFFGTGYDPATVRLSLVEAGAGKIGSLSDQLLLICYQFDPTKGVYTVQALQVMRLAGALTVIALLCVLVPAWMRSVSSNKSSDMTTITSS